MLLLVAAAEVAFLLGYEMGGASSLLALLAVPLLPAGMVVAFESLPVVAVVQILPAVAVVQSLLVELDAQNLAVARKQRYPCCALEETSSPGHQERVHHEQPFDSLLWSRREWLPGFRS